MKQERAPRIRSLVPIVARAATAAVLLLVLGVLAVSAASVPGKVGYPNSMASTGDSITRAFNTGMIPFTDATVNSWSTGASATVQSQYKRIQAANSLIGGKNHNDAKSGAKMADLNGQVTRAVSQHVEYVTILMGANDVCTSSEATMTSVSTYRTQFETAMKTLSTGLPNARIFVVTIPNVYHLWEILHTNLSARNTWDLFNICQSMLLHPNSTAQTDVDRRARVLQHVEDLNEVLRDVCSQYIHCRFDNYAGFTLDFVPSDIGTRDYFHPSVAGQTKAASVSWAATFDFTDNVAPTTSISVSPVAGGASVTLTADDNIGVAGIEYRLGSTGAVTRYTGPITVPTGTTLDYRAVDVNGNIEASKSYTP